MRWSVRQFLHTTRCWRHWTGILLAVFAIVVIGFKLRWSAVSASPTFGNQDIAGITYNADLLLHGKLPMVDDLEYKAPGSFFATALLFRFVERSAVVLERFGALWEIAAALGVFVAGWALFGTVSGTSAALIYTVWSVISDNLTTNYNTWMITPYIWATALFIVGLRRGTWSWFFSSGVLVALAGLMKRQGGVLAPTLGLILLIYPWLRRPAEWPALSFKRSTLPWILGLLVGFLPLTVFYLIEGGPKAAFMLLESFFFSASGWRYAAASKLTLLDKVDRLQDALLGFWEFMRLPTLLAGMTLASAGLARRYEWGVRGTLLGLHLLFSTVGMMLGFRFYMGYYLQVLPAAAWLAAAPDGPLLRWFRRDETWPLTTRSWLARGALVLAMVPFYALGMVSDLPRVKSAVTHRPFMNGPQQEAMRISKYITAHSTPADTIWVWGRWAWPVYFHANRLSCTRYYKVLGVITTNLDNTWKRPTSMTRFNRSGPWREVGAELDQCRPLFIVTASNESYAGFVPLERLLAHHYRRVYIPGTRSLLLYQRRDDKAKTHNG